jgi:hypothetical protein
LQFSEWIHRYKLIKIEEAANSVALGIDATMGKGEGLKNLRKSIDTVKESSKIPLSKAIGALARNNNTKP